MNWSCPKCAKNITAQLVDVWAVFCPACGTQVTEVTFPQPVEPVEDDWSPIQIGTKGKYKGKQFLITGRVRLQFKTDFRNLWCARYEKASLWINQSLECLHFLDSPITPLPANIQKIRTNGVVDLTERISLKCDYVAQVDRLQVEGEISHFPVPKKPWRIAEANNVSNAAFLIIDERGTDYFIWGEMVPTLAYPFENLREWNDWR